MPLLDLRPKLNSLECLHVSWLSHSCVGGPCSKILVGLHLLLLLQMIWCNTNRYLLWLWNLFLVDPVIALSTKSLVSAMALSLESHLFVPNSFKSLNIYQS